MKLRLSVFAAALAMLFAMGSATAEPLNIIVFDLDRTITGSKVGKNMTGQLEDQLAEIREKAEDFQEDLKDELEELQERKDLITADAYQSKLEELQLKELSHRRAVARDARAIQAGGNKAAAEIIKLAEAELNALAEARKADIVLRRNAVFFSSPTVDVTDELINRLNKEKTKIKVTPIDVEE